MSPSSIGARLDRLPLGAAHIRIIVVVGLSLFFDLFDVFLAGVLGTVLTASFGFDKAELPLVLSASFAGMFIGATCMGALADRFGRRPAFFLNLAVYSLFTLLGAFSMNAWLLIATRFMAGIGIGAQMPLADSYLSEILPARRRGALIAVAYTIGFVGNPGVALLARVLVPIAPLGVAGWRWLFVFGALGAVILWIAQRLLPESPRWLESVGRTAEAARVVDRLAGERAPAPVASPPPDTAPPRVPLRILWSAAYRRRTIMICVFHVFQTAGYYGFGTLVPLVLAAKGFSVLSSLTYTTIAFLGYPLGSALSVPLVERMDRRWLIIVTALLMCAFGILLGIATSPVVIGALGLLYTLTSNVFSNAFHIFQGEIFPTAIRATAAGTAYGLSRISSALMPFVLLPVLHAYGPTAMFVAVAAAMVVVIADIAVLAPSTTGKTLEQIAGV